MGVVIGRRGQTLDSVQYLANLVVNKNRDGYLKVFIDTENYRQKREETLIRLANKMAGKVRKIGKTLILEPMNPYERRIIHATLQGNPFVQTYSEGEEPYRKVAITPKKQTQTQWITGFFYRINIINSKVEEKFVLSNESFGIITMKYVL